MRKLCLIIVFVLFLISSALSDVTKKSVTKTSFMGSGQLIVTTDSYLKGNKQMHVSNQEFKGEGFLGKMLSKMFRGETGTLIDLGQKMVYNINFSKQSYSSMSFDEMASKLKMFENTDESNNAEKSDEEDNIIVLKNEIHIDNLNKTKTIAGYNCNGVKITWDYEYKEKDSDKHAAIQAVITLWTAPEDAKLSKMKAEEMEFGKQYAAALGLNKDFFSEDILGLKWFSMLGKMQQNKDSRAPVLSEEDMKKIRNIKGYPLASEGVFRAKDMSPKNQEMAEEEETDISKGLGGFFAKKLMKKKKKEANTDGFTTLFEFSTEVKSFSTMSLPDEKVALPVGFKEQ